MSDQQPQPPPGPGTGPAPGPAGAAGPQSGQPSEEEIRAYLAQLREADAAEIVAQAFNVLASGAQVKLGRQDGRLLIDIADALQKAAGGSINEQLTTQMNDALSQLRLAQVEAEGEAGRAAGQPAAGDAAEADVSPGARQTGQQAAPGSSARSKLWTPGR